MQCYVHRGCRNRVRGGGEGRKGGRRGALERKDDLQVKEEVVEALL